MYKIQLQFVFRPFSSGRRSLPDLKCSFLKSFKDNILTFKRLKVLLWCTHCSVLFWCPAGVWDWVGRLTNSADFVLWKVLQQNEAHQRGWREHRSHNGKRTDPGKTALNLFLITAKHDRFFLILEHPRELFSCLLIVSTLGVFLQTVRNTSGKSAAFSFLPCLPCLLQCPY